ncbi:MAG: hypothetical protein R8J85_05530 [Mariprofundales bacterium]
MYQDEVIKDVWKNRDAFASEHHYNLTKMVADLQARQKCSAHPLVDRIARQEWTGKDACAATISMEETRA